MVWGSGVPMWSRCDDKPSSPGAASADQALKTSRPGATGAGRDLTTPSYKVSTNSVIRSNASLIEFTLHNSGW